jgi:hypothetical protein
MDQKIYNVIQSQNIVRPTPTINQGKEKKNNKCYLWGCSIAEEQAIVHQEIIHIQLPISSPQDGDAMDIE